MKYFSLFFRLMLIGIVCSLSLPSFSQGVAIYKKDGTMVKYAYEEIDSIVAYNYGEMPGTSVVVPEAVDLGLPSGLKWAAHNVGATKPEDFGGYYAWGETEEKEDYSWSTYKWCKGYYYTMTKYCTSSSYGTVDNKEILDPEDDVAHVKWGGDWRIPTKTEQDELCNNCTWEWTTLNGVNGYKVTGPNGNSIFLPAAGYRSDSDLALRGDFCSYWSDSLSSVGCCYADNLSFSVERFMCYFANRYIGHSVRPVCK